MSSHSDIFLRLLEPYLAAQPPVSLEKRAEFQQIAFCTVDEFKAHRHQILEVFLLRLKGRCPPSLSLLHASRIAQNNLRILATCEYARLSLLGLKRQLCADSNWCSEADMQVVMRKLWPHMWKWIHGLYFQDTSGLDPATVQRIWCPDVRVVQSQLISLISKFLNGSCRSDRYVERILEDAPGVPKFVLSQWSSAAINSDDTTSSPLNRTLCHLARAPSVINDSLVAEAVGSSEEFAMCSLIHLQQSLRADYTCTDNLDDILIILGAPLTQSIHESLSNMGAFSQLISIIDYFTEANRVSRRCTAYGLSACLDYLMRGLSSSTSLSKAHEAFDRKILVSLIRVAHSGFDPSTQDHLSTFLVYLTRFTVFWSNHKAIKKSIRSITALGLFNKEIGHPSLDMAWDNFKSSMEEMDLDVVFNGQCSLCHREYFRSYFRKCSVCSGLYCSRECQESDWKSGGHRAVCRQRNPNDIVQDKDRQFLSHICCLKIQEFCPEISLLYQKYILTHATNNLPPLAVIIDCTTFPTTIKAGHPEVYLRMQVGDDDHRYQELFEGLFGSAPAGQRMVFFAEVPIYSAASHILMPNASQYEPEVLYGTYTDFLCSSGIADGNEAEATEKALQAVEEVLSSRNRQFGKPSTLWIDEKSRLEAIANLRRRHGPGFEYLPPSRAK